MPEHPITRRDLIADAAGLAVAATVASTGKATAQPATAATCPVAIASANGLHAVKLAVERMQAGSQPVDAAVAGVSLVEADPEDMSVGYGGLPNEEGVVQLDAAVMDGTTMRAGAVAAIERIMHPSQVALTVMRQTTRVLLVGEGALRFARAHGFPEQNLLTEKARKVWLAWRKHMSEEDDWLPDPDEANDPDLKSFLKRYSDAGRRPTGTIHLSACSVQGALGCCTTTSGLAFKISGRVGDSPLIGSGLYCDGQVGSAGGVGHGESNIIAAGAHTVVELMRQGKSPEAACLGAVERIAACARLPYLRDEQGRAKNNVTLFAVDRAGHVGCAALWSGARYALCRAGSEPQLLDAAYLYERAPRNG